MVKFHKSNWANIILSLFLLSVFTFIGVNTHPIAASKAETIADTNILPTIAPTSAAVIPPQAQITQANETVAAVPTKTTPVATTFKTNSGMALKIDAININIPLAKTTLDVHRTLLVPSNPNIAAWYKNGPVIGAGGTALITGHLDSAAGPGVFYNLKNLKAGETIQVRRDDGHVATFEINKLVSYPQDSTFPWNEVYATTGPSSLRIITCDGVYNSKTHRYSRNLVVYAALVSLD